MSTGKTDETDEVIERLCKVRDQRWNIRRQSFRDISMQEMRDIIADIVTQLKQRDGEGWTAGEYIETRFLAKAGNQ